MEDLITPAVGWLSALAITVLLASLIYVLLKVFKKAIRYKTTDVILHDGDVHSFDYSESHRLLMEREDIVQMTEQGYYDPMEQVFSLERWKQKVARYMQDYASFKGER